VINAVFPVLADNSAALGTAIAAAKGSTNPVVQLTADFYSTANSGSFIVIDADDADNSTPYTIKGTGIGSSADVLEVGILLANDKVTLQDVKFAVTNATKSAITPGIVSPATADSVKRYTAAVVIGRSGGGTGENTYLTGADLASKNVTVQNCDIAINYSADSNTGYLYTAGISIHGGPSTDIAIKENTVSSTGKSTNAAQALSIGLYHPSMVIIGNTLSSKTGGSQAVNAPAAALFINAINPSLINDSDTPQITGNTLDGKNVDFYANINSTGDYVGIPALFADNFGTYYSNWVTGAAKDTGSFYKKLYNALIPQAKAAGYAGLFFMSFGPEVGKWDGYCFTYEAWEKSGGAVTAIDYWGATILEPETSNVYNAEGKDTDANADGEGLTAHGEKAGYRGRITLSGSTVLSRDADFHWNTTDTNTTYPKKAAD
jgi:hypothetical protein